MLRKTDPPLYIRLRQRGDKVIIYLADGHGNPISAGNLLRLQVGKPVARISFISPKCGFPLNEKHQLRIQGLPEETT